MTGWSTFVRQATVVCLLLAVALGVVLLTVTHQAQSLEEELGSLRSSIVGEQQKIHVLQAEFSLLAEPERLRRLASAHLGLVPVEPSQLGTFATLDEVTSPETGASATTKPSGMQRAASKGHHR
ncbi:MAG: hypothetical protein U1E43_05945 [Rhodospirillales bacterium]